MKADKPLTGLDYINVPTIHLVRHPDYNPEVYKIVSDITKMTTKELYRLRLANETLYKTRRDELQNYG